MTLLIARLYVDEVFDRPRPAAWQSCRAVRTYEDVVDVVTRGGVRVQQERELRPDEYSRGVHY